MSFGASASDSGGSSSGGTRHTASPGTFSASRLVARIRSDGAARSSDAAKAAHASMRCSQLSRISSRWRVRSHSASVSAIVATAFSGTSSA